MDKSIKTWRVFLFGMCCILVSLYIKKILLSLEIIKGDFLSNSIVGVAVIWFIAGIFRLYHLKRTYPELKTVLSKDKWCIAESILIFILAVGLTLTGVGAHNTQMLSEIFQRDEDENITESIVNTEYGSIEDFSANNSMDIFVLNFNKESNYHNNNKCDHWKPRSQHSTMKIQFLITFHLCFPLYFEYLHVISQSQRSA